MMTKSGSACRRRRVYQGGMTGAYDVGSAMFASDRSGFASVLSQGLDSAATHCIMHTTLDLSQKERRIS